MYECTNCLFTVLSVNLCHSFTPYLSALNFHTVFRPFTKPWKFNTVSSAIMLVSLMPTGYTAFDKQVNAVCTTQYSA